MVSCRTASINPLDSGAKSRKGNANVGVVYFRDGLFRFSVCTRAGVNPAARPQPSTLNPQLSTLNSQLSTLNYPSLMTVHDIKKVLCRRCYAVLDVEDKFCRHCGTATGDSEPTLPPSPGRSADATRPQGVPAPSNVRSKSLDNRWVILVLLFAVLGPGAVPMLWRSSQFSLFWKTVLTVLVLGITALAIWLLWYVTEMTLAPLKELKSLKGF